MLHIHQMILQLKITSPGRSDAKIHCSFVCSKCVNHISKARNTDVELISYVINYVCMHVYVEGTTEKQYFYTEAVLF